MVIHVVGYPHTDTTAEYAMCGFTQKTIRFCRMMKGRGYTVYLYGGTANEAPCDEFIPCMDAKGQEEVRELKHYIEPSWNPAHRVWRRFNLNVGVAIKQRCSEGDPVFILGGSVFKELETMLPMCNVIENGIGYQGYCLKHRIWESQQWKILMGQTQKKYPVGWAEPVIPSFWDHNDFKIGKGEGYLTFVGRLVDSKGLPAACEAAQRAGRRLLVCGAGERKRVTHGAEYLGELSIADRNKLIAGADALLCPSRDFEAFGNVVPEAGFHGTPVISSDMGAFIETVEHGATGWRARNVEEIIKGITMLPLLASRELIRQRAIDRWSFDAIAPKYDSYIESLTATPVGC